MNPIHQLMSILCSREKRECPNCNKVQVILTSKKIEKVKCKFCGKIIPPKKQF